MPARQPVRIPAPRGQYGEGHSVPPEMDRNAVNRERLFDAAEGRVLQVGWADCTPCWLIGANGELLDQPSQVNAAILEPGEQVDLVIDFGGPAPGDAVNLALHSSANEGTTNRGSARYAGLFLTKFRIARESSPPRRAELCAEPITCQDPVMTRRSHTLLLATDGKVEPRTPINPPGFAPPREYPESVAHSPGCGTGAGLCRRSSQAMHGLQFQVASRNDPARLGLTDASWQDTVLMLEGEAIQIAIQFTDYMGLFVMHCRNLAAGEGGVMENVEAW